MELCEKLKQIRKENNLTQQQLADELCLSRTVITKYERGYRVPNLDTLILISNYFKTSIFDEYKNKFKLFFLSIKCIIPYLISLIVLLCSSLTLITNTIKINNQYGYNIYNDELKVRNSNIIIIIKKTALLDNNLNKVECLNFFSLFSERQKPSKIILNNKYLDKSVVYFLIFDSRIKEYINDNYNMNEIVIFHKPFIYPLKDYEESLPYNKQTGECSKILNYYIDLIEKVK